MSENKKHANQQNAKLSTGPKSQQGKIVVKTNALKHGLRAKQIIIFDESEEEFNKEMQLMTAAPLNPDAPIYLQYLGSHRQWGQIHPYLLRTSCSRYLHCNIA